MPAVGAGPLVRHHAPQLVDARLIGARVGGQLGGDEGEEFLLRGQQGGGAGGGVFGVGLVGRFILGLVVAGFGVFFRGGDAGGFLGRGGGGG